MRRKHDSILKIQGGATSAKSMSEHDGLEEMDDEPDDEALPTVAKLNNDLEDDTPPESS